MNLSMQHISIEKRYVKHTMGTKSCVSKILLGRMSLCIIGPPRHSSCRNRRPFAVPMAIAYLWCHSRTVAFLSVQVRS